MYSLNYDNNNKYNKTNYNNYDYKNRNNTKICKYFNSPNGCIYQNKCKFIHLINDMNIENMNWSNNNKNKYQNKNKHIYMKQNKDFLLFDLYSTHSFNIKNEKISSISSFPSGKIIVASYNKFIKIFDNNFNILQILTRAHKDAITIIEVKDERKFFSCSWDRCIKIWELKNNDKYYIQQVINNAHEDIIFHIYFYKDYFIINSQNKIKIWELKKKNYQNILNICNTINIKSILILSDINFLVFSDDKNISFYNLNNFELITNLSKGIISKGNNIMKRLDKDRFVLLDHQIVILIFSVTEKKIIHQIEFPFSCFDIMVIKEKGIFLLGGNNSDILVYKSDNYEFIQRIKNSNKNSFEFFFELKGNLIGTFWTDETIKIWSYEN